MTHLDVLKRTGKVLLIVGLIDITVMIYCIVNQIPYSSSFNVFAVIAGIFMMRGSFKAATIVRWFSLFAVTGLMAVILAWPLLQPFDLTITQIRLSPKAAVGTIALMVFFMGLLFWLVKELGSEPIQAARANANLKPQATRLPIAIALASVLIMGVVVTRMQSGDTAVHAKSLAEQQIGPGYRLFVSSINIAHTNNGTFASGNVTAWNEREIKEIPFHWEEQ